MLRLADFYQISRVIPQDKSECMKYGLNLKQQIDECIDMLIKALGTDLLGVYLYGSFLVGGLQKYSDIDLFVVTNRSTTEKEKMWLISHLLQISGIYMKDTKRPIEMTLVTKKAINPWHYPSICDFQYGEWLRHVFATGNFEACSSTCEMPDLALIITQILLKSRTLFGKKPEELLVPVPFSDFIKAMLHDLEGLMTELETDTRNVLLTYARIWSTLETSEIRSKPDAADWVIQRLPKTHQPVLNRAKSICLGMQDEYWDDIKSSIKPCADFMLGKINEKKLLINLDLDTPGRMIRFA